MQSWIYTGHWTPFVYISYPLGTRYAELAEHKSLNVWKLLIYNDHMKEYSLGQYLVDMTVEGVKDGRKVWHDVESKHIPTETDPQKTTTFNIIELDSYNVRFFVKFFVYISFVWQ